MAKFLVYLFESGLCLSLFYLGYIAFFRKETYFTFNRVYLVASMVLALSVPLLPVQLKISDSEYLTSTIQKLGQFRSYYEELILITDPDYAIAHDKTVTGQNDLVGKLESSQKVDINTTPSTSFKYSTLLFYIYIAGLLFFAIRLMLLLLNLYLIIKRNRTYCKDGITIVLIKEEMPSFSFLKWVFVNKEALKPEEFEQVITHEKVHVDHKHSVDLILAHIITMFQWFNPLTWRIQKSLKTCHEYIADRRVIDKGHELFDYQSLLLSQLISIRSVELVNNFNLLSIKKRIAMMNKIQSGRQAKLKALFVIPLLLVAFFFFADMTGVNNKGIIEEEIFEMSEPEVVQDVVIPTAKSVKVYDYDYILFNIVKSKDAFYFDGKKANLNNISKLLKDFKVASNQSEDMNMSVLLEIDKSVKMKDVDVIKGALRNNRFLKLGYAAKPDKSTGMEGSKVAIRSLLPPPEAKEVDVDDLDKEGIRLFTINHSSSASWKQQRKKLHQHVLNNEKYVLLYEYSNATSYQDYIQTLDMIYSTVWNIRIEQGFFKGYSKDMTKAQEKEMRQLYPLTLTMRNVDSE